MAFNVTGSVFVVVPGAESATLMIVSSGGRRRRKGGHRHGILGSVDPHAETRHSKKVIQAHCSDKSENDPRNEPVPKGQQREDDYIGGTGCGTIEVEPEANQGQESQSGGRRAISPLPDARIW